MSDLKCSGVKIALGLSLEAHKCTDRRGNEFKRYGVGIGPQIGVGYVESDIDGASTHAVDGEVYLGPLVFIGGGSEGHFGGIGLGAGAAAKYSYTHPVQALKPAGQ